MNITETLIDTVASGTGFVAAQVAENKFGNKLKGFAGSAIATGLGTVLVYASSEVKGEKLKAVKNGMNIAGTTMLAYGVFSGVKKLVMKSGERRTGLLLDIEQALPGKLLPAPAKAPAKPAKGVKGLGYDEQMLQESLSGLGYDDQIQQMLSGAGLSEDFQATAVQNLLS